MVAPEKKASKNKDSSAKGGSGEKAEMAGERKPAHGARPTERKDSNASNTSSGKGGGTRSGGKKTKG